MLRKIFVYVFILSGIVVLAAQVYQQITNEQFCNSFMGGYLQNSPTDIVDYTQQDINFSEQCEPNGNDIGVGIILVGIGVTAALLKNKKAVISRN